MLQECGSHLLALSCALWVYNLSGVPIALQPSTDEGATSSEVRRLLLIVSVSGLLFQTVISCKRAVQWAVKAMAAVL